MSRDKQTEIANDLNMHCVSLSEQFCGEMSCNACISNWLYNAGYRKSADVAEEIFAEIEKEIEEAIESNYRAKREHYNHSVIPNYDNFNAMCDGKIYAMRGLLDFIAELKKKYTEEGK